MKLTTVSLCIALTTLLCTTGNVSADLIVNASPNGSGGTQLVLNGSGLTAGGSTFIHYGTSGDSFVPDGTPSQGGFPTTPTFSLAGVNGTRFAAFDAGFGGIHSSIEFDFSDEIPLGASVSDLNGTYEVPGLDFSLWSPGTYNLQSNTSSSAILVGNVTLNIVPEPSAFVLLGTLAFFVITKRIKRLTNAVALG